MDSTGLHILIPLLSLLLLSSVRTEPKQLRKCIYFNRTSEKVYLEENSTPQLQEESDTYVYAGDISFYNKINESGWAFLELNIGNAFESDEDKAFWGGYTEGKVTAQLIYAQWNNVINGLCDGDFPCAAIKQYLETNEKWIKQMIRDNRKDPYWRQVNLFYTQLRGLHAGYNDEAKEKGLPILSLTNLYLLNIQGDLEDLGEAFKNNTSDDYMNLPTTRRLGPSCSALVKILPNNADVLVAHDTWSGYNTMLRILKKYRFSYKKEDDLDEGVPGEEISFSSYPGVILSIDDIYTMSPSRLTTLETTIGNSNPDNWKYINPNGQVLESVRTMVANRLAPDSKTWATIFKNYNSGTYNNHWMIVDWKKFTPGLNPKTGFLRVLEQIPGLVIDKDLTDILVRQTYWPSYNVPYFKTVFVQAGNQKLVDKFGDWFSYDFTPRALIFKRDHHQVDDLKSMFELMQYNNFQHDPLSKCNCTPPYNAENGISARNDLNPPNGTYPFSALRHRSHGGIDTKITSHKLSQSLTYYSKSGPAAGHLPTFCWSTSDFSDKHILHPDCWNFEPIVHKWRQTGSVS